MSQYRLGSDQLESRFAEENLGVLEDSEVDYGSAMCPYDKESQWHPGLH